MVTLYIYKDNVLNLIKDTEYKHCPLLKMVDDNIPGFSLVSDPASADFIVFPYLLDQIAYSRKDNPLYLYNYLRSLPLMREYERKHIFFMLLDHDKPFFTDSVFFRTNVNRAFPDVNAIAMPFAVEDFDFHSDFTELKFHTSFIGNINSHPVRKIMAESLQNGKGMNIILDTTNYMYYYNNEETKQKRLELFKESLRKSITVLCPRGYGLSSFRFFEAMSAGRIPVVISDNFVMPLESEIDYRSFCLFIPEIEAANCYEIIKDWLASQTAEEIITKCQKARYAFQTGLSPAVLNYFIQFNLESVKQKDYKLRFDLSEEVYALFGLNKKSFYFG